MSWTEADIPDLTGKTAVVTGANGGLGLETARALAAQGRPCGDGRPRPGQGRRRGRRHPRRGARGVARAGRARPELAVVGPRGGGQDPRVSRPDRHPGQQRRRDGYPRAPDRGRVRDAACHQPPRPLRPDGAADAGAVAGGRRAGGQRHEHRPPHGPRRRPRQPAPRGPVHPVAGLRPIQARQLPLRHRSPAAVRGQARFGVEPARSPRPVQHRPPGCQCARDRGRAQPAVLPRPRGQHRHVARAWRAAPAAGGDRPCRRGRRVLRAALCQQRAAGAQADRPPDRHGPCDRAAVGGVRARDRPRSSRSARRFPPRS